MSNTLDEQTEFAGLCYRIYTNTDKKARVFNVPAVLTVLSDVQKKHCVGRRTGIASLR